MTTMMLAGRSRSSILWVRSDHVSHLQPQSWRDVVGQWSSSHPRSYLLLASEIQPKNCSQERLQVANSFEKAAICSWLIREQKERRTGACDELFTWCTVRLVVQRCGVGMAWTSSSQTKRKLNWPQVWE